MLVYKGYKCLWIAVSLELETVLCPQAKQSTTRTERKSRRDNEENKFELAFISDDSRLGHAVQAAFSTIDADDSSKCTGDLSKAFTLNLGEEVVGVDD